MMLKLSGLGQSNRRRSRFYGRSILAASTISLVLAPAVGSRAADVTPCAIDGHLENNRLWKGTQWNRKALTADKAGRQCEQVGYYSGATNLIEAYDSNGNLLFHIPIYTTALRDDQGAGTRDVQISTVDSSGNSGYFSNSGLFKGANGAEYPSTDCIISGPPGPLKGCKKPTSIPEKLIRPQVYSVSIASLSYYSTKSGTSNGTGGKKAVEQKDVVPMFEKGHQPARNPQPVDVTDSHTSSSTKGINGNIDFAKEGTHGGFGLEMSWTEEQSQAFSYSLPGVTVTDSAAKWRLAGLPQGIKTKLINYLDPQVETSTDQAWLSGTNFDSVITSTNPPAPVTWSRKLAGMALEQDEEWGLKYRTKESYPAAAQYTPKVGSVFEARNSTHTEGRSFFRVAIGVRGLQNYDLSTGVYDSSPNAWSLKPDAPYFPEIGKATLGTYKRTSEPSDSLNVYGRRNLADLNPPVWDGQIEAVIEVNWNTGEIKGPSGAAAKEPRTCLKFNGDFGCPGGADATATEYRDTEPWHGLDCGNWPSKVAASVCDAGAAGSPPSAEQGDEEENKPKRRR